MCDAIVSFRGEYGFLSNMHAASFVWDGRAYTCSEAAFQSAKTLEAAERDAFSQMTGVTAKRAGKKVLLRPDWEEVKDGIMEEVVRAKFVQNPELLERLIATGERELKEGNRWHDTYWGVDAVSGKGENRLGRILMKIREELGGVAHAEAAAQMRAEKEETARRIAEEVMRVRSELASMPEEDFTGAECLTKAFGKVVIARQEGHYLFFEARGTERKFALPGCILQGFLTPLDAEAVARVIERAALQERLRELEKTMA